MGNSMFLRIALVFLIMKKVSAIVCIETNPNPCSYKKGKKEVIECLQDMFRQRRTLTGDVKCTRATFKLEDDTEIVVKSFDDSPNDKVCKREMPDFKERLEAQTQMKVKNFNCDTCKEDICNDEPKHHDSKKKNEAISAENAAILMSLMSLLVYLLF